MIRTVLLYLLYLKEKFRLWNKVSFRGFTVVYAYKDSRIIWGNKVIINSHPLSNLAGMRQRAIIVARYGGTIRIGNGVEMSGMTIYAYRQIVVGDRTMIGANTIIMDTDFHPLQAEYRHGTDRSLIKRKPVSIGKDCFIGMNVTICKGTVLGDRCVVGAGSVVCGEFPADCIIAGNPAKIIRICK
ncbi:acyltransferase [Parabacteroides bouchesdurhonensis]|uniref:acyltransferase n=1 Tax=Parabacteroides bouchesdurhonensis TaxID=1936995 RepID=UPI000C8230F2|nr:acyltransferase [Parabacteroides bouchesdurhonensis]